jgi:RNA polymerase sigma factor (sigma-70 family)
MRDTDALFRAHAPSVYRRALRILRSRADAEDAVQEIFARAFTAEFDGRSSASTWLYRITVNYCLNQIRNRRTRGEVLTERADTEGTEANTENWVLFREILTQADEREAEAALAVFVDGMSHEEAAEVLGVSRRTIGNLLERFGERAREVQRRSMKEFASLRAGTPSCPSELVLDRMQAGEAVEETVRAHVRGCAHCQASLAQRVLPASIDPTALLEGLHAASGKRRNVRWLYVAASALGMAAALALWVRTPPESQPQVRSKGSVVLRVFRQSGQGAEELLSGAVVHPGDRLRFVVGLPAAGYVFIVGREGSGKLYRAWPLNGEASAARDAGANQELPGAVALDASLGKETLYLVQCAQVAAGCTSAADGISCPDTCAQTPFVLRKEPR